MNILEFTIAVGVGSFAAGLVGALTGLGGGIVIVPLLVMACGVDIHYAIGVSLVSVIATSSGAAAAYVSEGFSNVRIAMLLEIATTPGRSLRGGARNPHSDFGTGGCVRRRPAVFRVSLGEICGRQVR